MLVTRNEIIRSSSVSIVTRIRPASQGSILGRQKVFFITFNAVLAFSELLAKRVPQDPFLGEKRPSCGSPLPSSADVKNVWSYASSSPYVLCGCD
jgi:hypothetical protein